MRNTTGKILGSVFAAAMALVITVGLTSPADAAVQYTANMAFGADSDTQNPNNYDGGTDDGYDDNTTGVYGGGFWNLGYTWNLTSWPNTDTVPEDEFVDSYENPINMEITWNPTVNVDELQQRDSGESASGDETGALWESYAYAINEEEGKTVGGDFTITADGLAAAKEVNLVIYSGWGYTETSTEFTFDGTTKTANNTNADWDEAFTEDNNYVKFEGITADADGKITFNMADDPKPVINGFQMEVIPEPSSFALLLLGSLALFHRRRRRNS